MKSKLLSRTALVGVISLGLAGCETLSGYEFAGGAIGATIATYLTEDVDNPYVRAALIAGGTIAGTYIGGEIGRLLSEEDQEKFIETQQTALATGETQTFSNPDTGVSGRVEVVETNVTPPNQLGSTTEVTYLRDRVDSPPSMTLISAPYRAANRSNVRSGPGTDYRIVSSLDSGEVVQAIGRVRDSNWYMISEGGPATGFVHASLLAPTTQPLTAASEYDEAEVVSASVDVNRECRTVRQSIVIEGETLTEDQTLCQQGNGTWQIV